MTKRSLRAVQCIAVAAAGAMSLTACSSSGGGSASKPKLAANYSYGSIPAASPTITNGGTVSFADPVGATPNWILPILPDADNSVFNTFTFEYLMYRQLYWYPQGSNPVIDYSKSLADAPPVVSNGGKTFTITLNGKYTWSNGTPVTAQDVLFDFDLMKAGDKVNAANNADYIPGQYPDNVTSAVAVNSQTVQFTFNKVYNPKWVEQSELTDIIPLPSAAWSKTSANGPIVDFTNPANATAIFNFLYKQSSDVATYATNPLWQVVDGAFKMSTYNPSTGASNLAANSAYTGADKPHIANFDEKTYTSVSAEWDDMMSGNLTIGFVDPSDLPQVNQLKAKGFNVYGLPDFGFNDVIYNFTDKTDNFDKVIGQLYIRQALAAAQDQQAEITGAWKGAGVPQYSTVGLAPKSPYTPANALVNPEPFSIANASKLLSSHGWTVVPNGKSTCTDPGTGPNQCGAGIPKGQDFTFPLAYNSGTPALGIEDTAWASNLKALGINAQVTSGNFNSLIQNDNVVASPKLDNDWAMVQFGGDTDSIYPTTNGLFNTGGPENDGGFSDPALDSLINDSLNSTDPNAISNELAKVTADMPVLFTSNPDLIMAWKNTLSGPSNAFSILTQYAASPEDFYFTKQQ
jgi:peptide/nickel transport system substrate-binding protein